MDGKPNRIYMWFAGCRYVYLYGYIYGEHIMKEGVYFDMPEEEYHAIEALSSSGIKWLEVSLTDFWYNSWMNPRPERRETSAMEAGSAYHKMILEGFDEFKKTYSHKFDGGPNLLKTSQDLKEKCKELELKVGGNKDILIDRILEAEPTCGIWDVERDKYEQENEGKIFLGSDLIDQIQIADAMIKKNPDLAKCFDGGYSEVTVIWSRNSVKIKSRLDYLKTQAIVDLKSFSNPLRKPIERAVISTMANNKYYIQASLYMQSVAAAVRLCREDKIIGYVNSGWLEKFMKNEQKTFMFVFQQTGPVPIAIGRVFDYQSGARQVGDAHIDDAITTFKNSMEKFGTDMWIDDYKIETFSDGDFPAWSWE